MKTIDLNAENHGTSKGVSYYETVLKCSKLARLNKEHPAPPEKYFEAGTAYHALMKYYYMAEIKGGDYEFTNVIFDETVPLASQCFEAYRKRYSRDEIGQVLATEKAYTTKLRGVPFSFRPDLLVAVDGKKHWRKRFSDPPSGTYIVDHKLYKSFGSGAETEIKNHVRFWLYQMAMAKVLNEPIAGVLLNVCFKTKVPVVYSLIIPPPTPLQKQIALQWLDLAVTREQTQIADSSRCFDGRWCHQWVAGRCDRT